MIDHGDSIAKLEAHNFEVVQLPESTTTVAHKVFGSAVVSVWLTTENRLMRVSVLTSDAHLEASVSYWMADSVEHIMETVGGGQCEIRNEMQVIPQNDVSLLRDNGWVCPFGPSRRTRVVVGNYEISATLEDNFYVSLSPPEVSLPAMERFSSVSQMIQRFRLRRDQMALQGLL